MYRKPREIAVRFLCNPPDRGFTEANLDRVLEGSGLDSRDRSLTRELVYGIIRQRDSLGWLISRLSEGRPQKEPVATLLKLGLYQLFWLDRVPAHAAINETVALAKKCGAAHAAGFINALLRRSQRESTFIQADLENLEKSQPWSAGSHPRWLFDRWSQRWGTDTARVLMDWNNSPASTFARVNSLNSTAEELLEIWGTEGVQFEPLDIGTRVPIFKLIEHPPISTLPSFIDGRFYIQDPSTLHAVEALDPQPGENILDACAAPGGKTTYIAQMMGDNGAITAHDPSEKRLARLEENRQRMGATCVSLTNDLDSLEKGTFDRILADVPCSNTGVMRRRVDLRWRITSDEIERLTTQQLQILDRLAPFLKPTGTLVYSTCSLEAEENEQVIDRFLESHPEFKLVSQRAITPFADQTDGAFNAILKKQSDNP